jgi:hypothetical protein
MIRNATLVLLATLIGFGSASAYPETRISQTPTQVGCLTDGIAVTESVLVATTVGSSGLLHVIVSQNLGETWIDVPVPGSTEESATAVAAWEGKFVVAVSGPPLEAYTYDPANGVQGPTLIDAEGRWPSLAARDGVFFVAYEGPYVPAGPYTHEILFKASTDGGLTWQPSPAVAVDVAEIDTANVDLAAGEGRLHLIWMDQEAIGGAEHIFYAHSDDGLHWTAPVALSAGPGPFQVPAIALFEDEVHAAWHDHYSGWTLQYRRSLNRGDTWQPARSIAEGRFPDIVADTDGVHIVNSNCDGHPVGLGIWLSDSPDRGTTWRDPVLLSYNLSLANHPHAVSAFGIRHLVLQDARPQQPNYLWYDRDTEFDTGVESERTLVGGEASGLLFRAGPSPFRSEVLLDVSGGSGEPVSIAVFDVSGRLVRTLAGGGDGAHALTWDGRDAAGHPLPAGPYFFLAMQGERRAAAKALLIR